jgi:ABC-type sulfate transport system substrate-binding protein
VFRNAPVLDTAARGATTSFVRRNIGDVLLAWENEAYLALKELGEDQFDIVVPSISVLAEPPVAVVEANVHDDTQRKLAEAYLTFLYTPEAQAIIFKNFYRGWDTSKADPADLARFPKLELVDIGLNAAASIQVVDAELLLQSLHTFIGQIALAGIELLPQRAFFNVVFDVQAFTIALRVVRHGP